MWLAGRLTPDFETIADFRCNNGTGIRNVCKRFIAMCRQLKLFSQAIVAIDGRKFKAVNSRDRNFTPGKIDKRQEQIEQSIQRYLDALETADRTQPMEEEVKTGRLRESIRKLREQMRQLDGMKERLETARWADLVHRSRRTLDGDPGQGFRPSSTVATSAAQRSRPPEFDTGITAFVPTSMTSNAKAEGRFDKGRLRLYRAGQRMPVPRRRAGDPSVRDGGESSG